MGKDTKRGREYVVLPPELVLVAAVPFDDMCEQLKMAQECE